MKTTLLPLLVSLHLSVGALFAADPITESFQKALFEEEANQNLDAAIKAYQAVIDATDAQRRLTATAVFRLGECYRKLGQTNAAVAQFQRLLRDYVDQTNLVTLSRQNLAGLGVRPTPTVATAGPDTRSLVLERELAAQEADLTRMRTLYSHLTNLSRLELTRVIPTVAPDAQLATLLETLSRTEQQLAEMQQQFSQEHPEVKAKVNVLKKVSQQVEERVDGIVAGFKARTEAQQAAVDALRREWDLARAGTPASATAVNPAARAEQKRLLEQEIKLAEDQLAAVKEQFKAGVTSQTEVNTQEREVLALKRQLAGLDAGGGVASGAFAERLQAIVEATQTDEEEKEIRRLQALIQNSPDLINAIGNQGSAPLHEAASKGWLRVARFLLDHGADVDVKTIPSGPSSGGWTPLHRAAVSGHKDVVELLVARKADVQARTGEERGYTPPRGGETPLHLAANRGFKTVVEVLLAHGAAVNAKDNLGQTPLHLTTSRGLKAVAELLLANQAEVNAKDNAGETPLHEAARAGQTSLVVLLLEKGADVNAKAKNGAPPLAEAIQGKHMALVSMLLARKPDLNWELYTLLDGKNCHGGPCHWAVWAGNLELLELLLKSGADPNMRSKLDNYKGWTPLRVAVSENQKDAVELLLKWKADPNIPSDGSTPLHVAVDKPEILKLLLANKAAVDARDKDDMTPLAHAMQQQLPEAATVLLAQGADPNATNNFGWTPLHIAVAKGDKELVELLLANKADPNIQSQNGETALDLLRPNRSASAGRRGPFDGGVPVPGLAPPGMPARASRSGAPASASSEEIAAALRRRGGLEDLPRRDRIEARRSSSGYANVTFRRGTNDFNRFTLLELIAAGYQILMSSSGQSQREMIHLGGGAFYEWPLKFPDFANVVIRRPAATGTGREEIRANLESVFKSGACTNDLWLEWGDVVEIPEADHAVNEAWTGLPVRVLPTLLKCLTRTVQLTAAGQTTNLAVGPDIVLHDKGPDRYLTRAQLTLMPALTKSGLLRTSSDLSRVRVTRRDPVSGQTRAWVFDCSKPEAAPDLWLRDGDVIEVPEK